MAPSITSEKITLTYPLFAADFLDADRLVVAGGGGEGRSGVGNKITLLDVSKSSKKQSNTETQITTIAEHELSREEDSCMSLAVASRPASSEKPKRKIRKSKASGAKILTGINSSEKSQTEGKNEHFRVFTVSDDGFSPVSQNQLFSPSSGPDTYQRVLLAKGSYAALASGGTISSRGPFELVVVSSRDYRVRRRIKTTSEVADLDLSEDGTLVYCTAKEIFSTSAESTTMAEPKQLCFNLQSGTLRSVRSISSSRILTVLNHPQRTGADILLIDAASGSVVSRKKLHRGIKAVTGLDTVELSSSQTAVAVAGADQSVHVLVVENDRIKAAQTFRNVHPFQISKVVFSPAPPRSAPSGEDEESEENARPKVIRLATTSIGNTVVVFTLPLLGDGKLFRSGAVAKQTAISVLLSLVAVVVFAVLLQVVFVTRVGLSAGDVDRWSWDGVRKGFAGGAEKKIAPLVKEGGIEEGGIEKGGIEKGGIEKGGIEEGGIEEGGIEEGGIEEGGIEGESLNVPVPSEGIKSTDPLEAVDVDTPREEDKEEDKEEHNELRCFSTPTYAFPCPRVSSEPVCA